MSEKLIIKKLQKFFKNNKSKVNFVHVDLLRSFKIDFINKKDFVKKHFELMKKCTNNSDLWFPSFNYNFSKKKTFHIQKDKSETGNFTELFRIFFSKWRTEIPIFNIIGDGKKPHLKVKNNSIVNPFDKNSFFHLLYEMKSNIFFYGTAINSASFIMYVEETMDEEILYRYKKLLVGSVISNKDRKKITLNLSVRPRDKNFPVEYDWDKIENFLKKKRLLFTFKKNERIFGVLNLKKVTITLQKMISKDPFFLLNNKSKIWLQKFYLKYNRGIFYSDFEK